jgi:hypothetical protein
VQQTAERVENFAILLSDTKNKQSGIYCLASDAKSGKNAFYRLFSDTSNHFSAFYRLISDTLKKALVITVLHTYSPHEFQFIVQVRGFAGWPGTWAEISISVEGKEDCRQDLKILRTELLSPEDCEKYGSHRNLGTNQIGLCSAGLLLPCGEGTVLLATRVQAPGKQACCAAAFGNGHNGKRLLLQ